VSCAVASCGTRTAVSGVPDGIQAHGGQAHYSAWHCRVQRAYCARGMGAASSAPHKACKAFELTGAALTPAACSSSFMALNDAVSDLQNGRTDYAMVGGSSALFRPATTVAFNQLQCARAPRPLLPGRDALACTWQRGLHSAAVLSCLQPEQPWPSASGHAAEPAQSHPGDYLMTDNRCLAAQLRSCRRHPAHPTSAGCIHSRRKAGELHVP
jgi:hypothetical protein